VTTQYDEVSRDGNPQSLPLPAGYPLNFTSAALSKSCIPKTGIGKLFGFTATSTNAAAQFVQIHDALALPGNGAVPIATFNVAAANSVSTYYGPMGRAFTRGIVIANSTTQATLTLGAADTIFDVQYV
jgi:hypothetical protein